MQKSLKAFAEKSPSLANKLGITNKLEEVESDSDEEPKNKSKYFKAREKERELQRKKGNNLCCIVFILIQNLSHFKWKYCDLVLFLHVSFLTL